MTDNLSVYHLERLGSHGDDFASIPLRIGANTVGRLASNNIVLNSKYTSRSHCTIDVAATETGHVTVKNVVATNGIFINGAQKLNRDADICLNINDILGIGCDTSNEEISDEGCFIFKLKRRKSEENGASEIIVLADSDEEEEDKIQEEYSQMNLSEMKQEWMEMEDFVEEYNRPNLVDVEHVDDVACASIECPTNVQQIDEKVDDVFEIIANANKSYAEKSELIKNIVPDVGLILMKDVCEGKDGSGQMIETKKERKKSTERKRDRKATIAESSAAKEKAKKTKITKNSTKVNHSPPARIQELHFTIPLKNMNAEIEPTIRMADASPAQKMSLNNSKKTTETSTSAPTETVHLRNRRNTFVPPSTLAASSTDERSAASNKPTDAFPSKITKRRNTFVPSCTLANGSLKRQLEIIDAPHMLKRRKSVSIVPETVKPPSKKKESKWLSKNVPHKHNRRSKEEKDEIKTKLAAIAPSPKEKIVEPKIIRTNTKIPVKNTHKTRSDQLTDTIVKTMTPPIPKHKPNDVSLPIEICKRLRMPETEKPNKIRLRSSSIAELVEKTGTEVKLNVASECVRQNGINDVSDNHPSDLPNFEANASPATATVTSPAVKSILKKSNSIQKRRVTVTFAEESRIKTIKIIPPTAASSVACDEEENSDDVIHNIMSLGMAALKEVSSTTINGKNFSYKTVAHEYETLRHLQNVFIPLMKAELWKEIEDGYARLKNTTATNVQLNYCVRDENHPNRFKYHCETQSSATIQNGALIMMLGVNSGKEFLGYIINRQIANKICYFQFVTHCSVQESGVTPTPLKLKQIMYIRPNLKVFEALFKLKNSPLLEHILHPKRNCESPKKQRFNYKGYNKLNQDQMITLSTVYRKCIAGHPFISLIEGPPGTGKSRLITNLVLQILYGKEMTQPLKILVCAPSNAAVDILTKNLMEARRKYLIEDGQKKIKLVRFGVLEKMDRNVRSVSLQELTKENNQKTVLIEQKKLMECKKKKEAELAFYKTNNVKEKINSIRNEIGAIEAKMKNVVFDEKCLLDGANVICTTLNSCCALSSKISSMDICIIDEATQCNEPTSLIPLQFGVKSLILVGDTKQLPSTVLSEIAKQYNYDQSLFQRLQKSFESANEFENPILQLTTQYRMHPEILHWPNEYFYKNCLVSADTTNNDRAWQLKPYTVFNLNSVQSAHTGQKHISNVDEAKFVCNLLNFLITKANPKTHSYGIISAYSQQKDDLTKGLSLTHPYVTVNTIDSCQGQERDIVIISIARTRGIGFLAIRQRLNVALTRAKKMLILCGNFNSLQSHPMWTSLLDDAKNRKLYVHLPTMDDSLLASYFEKTLTT